MIITFPPTHTLWIAALVPTVDAPNAHPKRVYFQTQNWSKDKNSLPTNWRWVNINEIFQPIIMVKEPAPAEFLWYLATTKKVVAVPVAIEELAYFAKLLA